MQKKILVSGFVLDNFLEISSFLEKNQIKRAKIEKKILHMLNTIVPSGELIHLAQGYKIQKMYHCLLQDFDKEAKEKECFISDRNLIYIAEDWIQLDQNILFILFYESPVEVLKQKACLNDKFYINDILNSWLKYNTFLLDFYKKNRERSILINYKDFDVALCKYLNEKYYFNMVKIYKENSSIKSKNLFDFLLEYMLNSNEKCLNCYKGLEGYSLNPNFNSNDLPFKNLESEIINLFQILKISEILSIKNKSLLDFIFEMQEYIEKLYYQHGNCLKEITFKKSQTIETKNKTIQENLSQINNLNQTIETKNKTIQNKDDLLNFQAQYGTAKSRIQNQLSYKLGQTMIVNSKSFLGCLLMPVILLGIVISYKQEQKIYKRKIEKDPSLKLPSLEQYPDYREAIKLKNHLSYKLGQSAIKFCKNPLKLWSLPYEIFKIIKNK